jgi:hypothetical protein
LFPSPQVLCSGTGAVANSTSLTSIGVCTIPPHILVAGDRIEIRYDFEHSGAATGFHVEVHWDGRQVMQRDGAPADRLISGRSEAGVHATGAQVSSQTWGATLPLATEVISAPGTYSNGVTIDFAGRMYSASGGETIALKNFTVIRFP